MNRKNKTFLMAIYLFLVSLLTGCKKETDEEIIKVIKTEPPTQSITEIIETVPSPTEPIVIETEPIIETEPVIKTESIIEKNNLLTLDEIALEVIGGKWGNGDERRNNLINLGYNYEEVANRVNEIMAGAPYTIPDRNTYIYNFGYVSEKVDVYDEYGNREGTLSKYQKVILTDKKINGMVFVYFKDQSFYLKEEDVKRLADSHLEIDISEQKVYMYIDGELILEADVITGYPGKGTTPGTNIGITEVYSKSYNVTFTEEKKSKYFILFNWDGEGFHDASWREDWEFNDKGRYLTHGSDGCTNMKEEDVIVIEENSYLGMPVLTHS